MNETMNVTPVAGQGTNTVMMTYVGAGRRRLSVAEWLSASPANEATLTMARTILATAGEGVGEGVVIPGVQTDVYDYKLVMAPYEQATRVSVYRADNLLITTLTIAPAGSLLAPTALDGATPPCCVVNRDIGELYARDTSTWLSRFEDAIALSVCLN